MTFLKGSHSLVWRPTLICYGLTSESAETCWWGFWKENIHPEQEASPILSTSIVSTTTKISYCLPKPGLEHLWNSGCLAFSSLQLQISHDENPKNQHQAFRIQTLQSLDHSQLPTTDDTLHWIEHPTLDLDLTALCSLLTTLPETGSPPRAASDSPLHDISPSLHGFLGPDPGHVWSCSLSSNPSPSSVYPPHLSEISDSNKEIFYWSHFSLAEAPWGGCSSHL